MMNPSPLWTQRFSAASGFASILALSLLLALSLASRPAQAEAPRWQYGHSTVVHKGQTAFLMLVPSAPVKQVKVRLSNDRKKRVQVFKIKSLPAGKKHKVKFKPPQGTTHWSAEVTGTFDAGPETVNFEFDLHVTSPLKVGIEKKDIYLEEGRAVISANQPLGRGSVTVTDIEGTTVVDEALDLTGQGGPKGGRFTLEWTPPGEDVEIKDVKLMVFDAHEAQNYTLTLTPFFVELPHEDVVFATNSAEIEAPESPKLHKALEVLNGYVKKWGNVLEARLYIGGYTDTVGNAADNRTLSTARAKAIATWFRAHGVRLPIYYQGFGESGLAVQTADGVDEARNRRAIYVLGASAPSGGQYTGGRWIRLK
ncbi:MAG: OmpA family protein [Bradymonadia bacterium]